MTEPGRIRAKVVCAFLDGGRILAYPIQDRLTGVELWRTYGGGMEFGETSVEALRREMREEIGCEIESPVLLGVLEGAFVWNGVAEHEICFVYDARLCDASLYARDDVPGREANGEPIPARWVALSSFTGETLVPLGLLTLLQARTAK